MGGALAAPYYGYGPYYPGPYYPGAYYPGPYDQGHYAAAPAYSNGGGESYCAQRFRSYDPSTGTYMGYDGQRHPRLGAARCWKPSCPRVAMISRYES